jgi:quinol-cytochrome oxidoreductase complex cytochrome b subunit
VFFQIPVFLHFYLLLKNKIAPPHTTTNNGDRAVRRIREHKVIRMRDK